MACGGLKFIEKDLSARFNKNFTQRVVELAIEMMKYIHGTTFTYGIKLSLKIGVHYGSCIYGVIGYHKPQFSLIGDTVNTTSRHCTTGENGTIVLSMAAKNKIDISQIAHFKTALVEMKGKGKVEVFMILPPKKNIISLEHIRDASGSIMDNTSNKIFMHSSGKRRATLGNQKTNELVTPRGGNAVTIEPFMEKKDLSLENLNLSQFSADNDEKIMAPEELRLDSPESKSFVGNRSAKPQQFYGISSDSNNISTNTAGDDSSDASISDLDLKNESKNSIDSYMKKKWGFAYGFRKNFKGLETYYNKQLRVKYKSKMRKTIFFLILMVVTQETLLYFNNPQEIEIYTVRLFVFIWIIMSFVFLFLSNKVYQISALALISLKTIIYIIEMYMINFNLRNSTERQLLSYFNFVFHSMLDSLLFISMGIFPVTLLMILNSISFMSIIVNTLILRLNSEDTPSLIAMVAFFYFINYVDLINHFDTELNLFFNYIGIEQKGYYLNTFVDRLLPKHIRGISANTECYSEVTLLFADIVGFTEYSAGKNPRQVVEMLSQLFTAFDKECNKLNLYKLYTIGDCYVVMSFLDKNNRKKPAEEANDVVQLAMFMITSIAEVRAKINFDKLNMRIGIHTGTVYGGVIGTDIVRFDLYGPDVLTANKMESNGTPGRINISETTRRYLDDLEKSNYSFEFNKEIDIKVVNRKYKSYFLVTGNETKEE